MRRERVVEHRLASAPHAVAALNERVLDRNRAGLDSLDDLIVDGVVLAKTI